MDTALQANPTKSSEDNSNAFQFTFEKKIS